MHRVIRSRAGSVVSKILQKPSPQRVIQSSFLSRSFSAAVECLQVNHVQDDVNTSVRSEKYSSRNKQKSSRKKRYRQGPMPDTEWILVKDIPPSSTLDDLLVDLERIVTTELSVGIPDLESPMDNAGTGDENRPLYQPDPMLPPAQIVEARLQLSTLMRPSGWYIRFANKSIVHSIMNHLNNAKKIKNDFIQLNKAIREENRKIQRMNKSSSNDEDKEEIAEPQLNWKHLDTRPLLCAWKQVEVVPFVLGKKQKDIDQFNAGLEYGISENVIRVENCPLESCEEDVFHFFSRYEFVDERESQFKPVDQVVYGSSSKKFAKSDTPSMTNSFLVRFASTANARAAIREKQNVEFMGKRLRLAQYSRQIL
ncbi:hypothetical protein CTEN210_15831 [Chaetoceros tenuissimus]|uniref:RRM domain-containing protein n=1 Tax=Chaetoceros tenuissimus TaxID=426638 RepID=A0AAD3D9P8_9STRA|nr:hypothetical protein CTEN210_15831 [Chaetoceros tenuissimus]